MSMTLPRWFGRKTRKKSAKNNDENAEKEHSYNPDLIDKSTKCSNSHFEYSNRGNQFTVIQFDRSRGNQDQSQYIPEQGTSNGQVTDSVHGDQLNEIQNADGYKRTENDMGIYSFDERERHNFLISPTIYGGR